MQHAHKAAAGLLAAAVLAGGAGLPAPARAASQEAPATATATATASGEVRRVDAAGGKVTIKHDKITALDLPAMTLVYRADPALLAGIRPGDKVRFTATRQDGRYVVTDISK
ncbi:copper-binding protein [Bordetella petrii]|uniref:copper-binding protein n=1 Tax=Bordetella petrii TaxID=94624 RepID=UPI001A95CE12|nr:copper-binding protein [Bordetella petrii]MBO1111459.1 copper-binding protein [Bordetella petrii]